jgi:hypothetical protein
VIGSVGAPKIPSAPSAASATNITKFAVPLCRIDARLCALPLGLGRTNRFTLIDSRSAITRTQRQYKRDSRVSVMEQSGIKVQKASGYSAAAFWWAKIRPSSKNCIRLSLPKWHRGSAWRRYRRRLGAPGLALAERARTHWFELRACILSAPSQRIAGPTGAAEPPIVFDAAEGSN